jgi:uracil-DNA glycosylase
MRGFFALSEVQTTRPDGMIPKCGACGLFRTCKSPKMKPYGHGGKDIVIVGEAPGQKEDEQGRPFVGKSGKLLRETLSSFGVTLDKDCIVTNSIICRPPNNAAPDPKQIKYCRPNLVRTLSSTQPRIVITLGNAALRAVVSEFWKGDIGKMERWVGWQIPTSKFWLCPTYHPSYILRQEKNRILATVWQNHLEAALDLDEAPDAVPNYRDQVEILMEEDRILEAIEYFDREGGWCGVDYEANCLKPEYPKAEAVSFSISNGQRTVAYPWWGKAIAATGRFLKSERTAKIASNIKMEDRWTRKMFGHGVRNWGWDTMLAAHCLDNRPHICSLKFLAFTQLGVSSYNENIEPFLTSPKGKHYNRIKEVALPTLLTYNGLDSLLEFWLAMKQRKQMGYP